MRRNRWPGIGSAFAIGIGVGAALGLLFAPQSGESLREDISDAAKEKIGEVVAEGKKEVRRLRKQYSEATDLAGDVVDTVDGAFREARKAAASS
jgi:gas vesicle protein